MHKNWSKPLMVLIGPVALFIGAAIFDGIIGGWATELADWLRMQLPTVTWLWVMIGFLFLLISYLFVVWFRDRHHLRQKMEELDRRSGHLIMLDSSLLRLLTILVSADDPEAAMHRLLKKLLHDAREAFPEVRKASLFLPDEQREYLLPWHSAGWIGEDADPCHKFYIANRDRDRLVGSAGEAFVRQEILITKFEESEGQLVPTRGSYVFFSDDRSVLPYCALVCVPIIAITDKSTQECLGVVCFDSKDSSSFDPSEIKTMLKVLGTRIAVAIEIYQRLKKICSIPQQKL